MGVKTAQEVAKDINGKLGVIQDHARSLAFGSSKEIYAMLVIAYSYTHDGPAAWDKVIATEKSFWKTIADDYQCAARAVLEVGGVELLNGDKVPSDKRFSIFGKAMLIEISNPTSNQTIEFKQ